MSYSSKQIISRISILFGIIAFGVSFYRGGYFSAVKETVIVPQVSIKNIVKIWHREEITVEIATVIESPTQGAADHENTVLVPYIFTVGHVNVEKEPAAVDQGVFIVFEPKEDGQSSPLKFMETTPMDAFEHEDLFIDPALNCAEENMTLKMAMTSYGDQEVFHDDRKLLEFYLNSLLSPTINKGRKSRLYSELLTFCRKYAAKFSDKRFMAFLVKSPETGTIIGNAKANIVKRTVKHTDNVEYGVSVIENVFNIKDMHAIYFWLDQRSPAPGGSSSLNLATTAMESLSAWESALERTGLQTNESGRYFMENISGANRIIAYNWLLEPVLGVGLQVVTLGDLVKDLWEQEKSWEEFAKDKENVCENEPVAFIVFGENLEKLKLKLPGTMP